MRPASAATLEVHGRAAEFMAGLAYATRDSPDESMAWLLEASRHAARGGKLRLGVTIVDSLTGVSFDAGHGALVAGVAEQFLALDGASHELTPEERAHLLIAEGRSLRYRGRADRAQRAFEKALEQAGQAGDRGLARARCFSSGRQSRPASDTGRPKSGRRRAPTFRPPRIACGSALPSR